MKRILTILLGVIIIISCSEKQGNLEKEVLQDSNGKKPVADSLITDKPEVSNKTKEIEEAKREEINKEVIQEKAVDYLKYDLIVEKRSMMETDLVTATIKNTHSKKVITKVQFRFIGLDEDNNQVHTQVLTINSEIKPTNSKSLKIDEEKLNLDCKRYKIQFINADFK